MSYQGSIQDIVYPDENGSPCVLRYRNAFTNTPQLLAVVHLQQHGPSFASPVSSLTVRDHILNRVIDNRLTGIPINSSRVAVEDDSGALEFDLHDYILRGRPYDSSPIVGGRRPVPRGDLDQFRSDRRRQHASPHRARFGSTALT